MAPVLSLGEAPRHPHLVARGTFVEEFGIGQPASAPRFSETPGRVAGPPPKPGAHTESVLSEWGLDAHLPRWLESAAVTQNPGGN